MYYWDHASFSRASQQCSSNMVIKKEVNCHILIPLWVTLMYSLSMLSNTSRLRQAVANVQPHIHQSFLEHFKPNHEFIYLKLKPLPQVSARQWCLGITIMGTPFSIRPRINHHRFSYSIFSLLRGTHLSLFSFHKVLKELSFPENKVRDPIFCKGLFIFFSTIHTFTSFTEQSASE